MTCVVTFLKNVGIDRSVMANGCNNIDLPAVLVIWVLNLIQFGKLNSSYVTIQFFLGNSLYLLFYEDMSI
jgi:hypothetical protein